jgi:hypothetical protein
MIARIVEKDMDHRQHRTERCRMHRLHKQQGSENLVSELAGKVKLMLGILRSYRKAVHRNYWLFPGRHTGPPDYESRRRCQKRTSYLRPH